MYILTTTFDSMVLNAPQVCLTMYTRRTLEPKGSGHGVEGGREWGEGINEGINLFSRLGDMRGKAKNRLLRRLLEV